MSTDPKNGKGNAEGASTKTERAEPAKPKRNPLRIIIPAVLILGIGAALIWYFFLRGPAVPPNLIEVSGRIESDESAISPKTSGRIPGDRSS